MRLYTGSGSIDMDYELGFVSIFLKSISLTLGRFKNLLVGLQFIEEALKENRNYQFHLGGNVYCSVRENNPCVEILLHT